MFCTHIKFDSYVYKFHLVQGSTVHCLDNHSVHGVPVDCLNLRGCLGMNLRQRGICYTDLATLIFQQEKIKGMGEAADCLTMHVVMSYLFELINYG